MTDSYRLYSTLNRLCERPNLWYNSGPSQKYILRQIKAMDLSLGREETRESSVPKRASYPTKEKDDDPTRAKELDIALLMLYGHILYTGTSHAYALSRSTYALGSIEPLILMSERLLLPCICSGSNQSHDHSITRIRVHTLRYQETIGEQTLPTTSRILVFVGLLRYPPRVQNRSRKARG